MTRRFAAPPRYIPQRRPMVGGLSSSMSEDVPQGANEIENAERESGPPARFTGIRSRSRFFGMLTPAPVGHGTAQDLPEGVVRSRDPAAGETQFDDVDWPVSLGEGPYRAEFDASLGQTGPALVRDGLLAFVRKRRNQPESVKAIVGQPGWSHAADLPRWSAAGPPPPSMRTRRFTMRSEFEQDAQSFSGLRLYAIRGASVSSSPVRMLPPRTDRLTQRDLPRSFGATTEVMTDAG